MPSKKNLNSRGKSKNKRANDITPVLPEEAHLAGLTEKQKAWIKKSVELGDPTKAAGLVYDSKNPNLMAWENKNKPYLREAYIAELRHCGVTEQKLSSKLAEGLEATKVQTSPTEEDREIPDFQARLGYLKEANKVFDVYPDRKINIDKRQANINIYAGMKTEALEKKIEELEEELEEIEAIEGT